MERNQRFRTRTLALVCGGIGLIVDQLTKAIAVAKLVPGEPVPVLGKILQLNLVRNPGAAFSLGENATWLFASLAVLVLLAVGVYVLPRLAHRGWAVAVGLVTAGVAGNLADRIFRSPGVFRGHVVDFLELPNWPIFNVADMCIVCGAGLVAVLMFFAKTTFDGKPVAEQPEGNSAAKDRES